jgi:hypothetical protein
VKSRRWDRGEVIADIREDIWRHISQAARHEPDMLLEAAALLQMSRGAVRTLALRQFLISEEVQHLLGDMPSLIRRLATTTTRDEEWSAERVRGPIDWAVTLGARAATGLGHLYVTSPARRAHQTPENELLVAALDAIRASGRKLGWHRSESEEIGYMVRERVLGAEGWLARRSLGDVERRPISSQTLARVRTGRHARRYSAAIAVYMLYQHFLRRLERTAIRDAIERHAVATTADEVLLELLCAFRIEKALETLGWKLSRPGLVRGGRLLQCIRGPEQLDVYYQQAPATLRHGSIYRGVQKTHGFPSPSDLRPDLVVHHRADDSERWLLVEIKGVERDVAASARAALLDLLAYRRAFEPVLSSAQSVYGLGIAWGTELVPSLGAEIALCSPDRVHVALQQIFE